MNLSPFEMKMLLYHILSGKELVVPNGMFVSVHLDLLTVGTFYRGLSEISRGEGGWEF